MSIKSINQSEIQAIHHFLRSAIYDFHAMNCQSDELIISVPNWLQIILRSYPMVNYVDHNAKPIEEFEEKSIKNKKYSLQLF